MTGAMRYAACEGRRHDPDTAGWCRRCGAAQLTGWMVTWRADDTIRERSYRHEADAHADAAELRAAGMPDVRVSTFTTPDPAFIQWWDRHRQQLAI